MRRTRAQVITQLVAPLFAFALLTVTHPIAQAETASPASPFRDFTPLFNGKDLTGWWGEGTTDPKTYLKLDPDALAQRKKASIEDPKNGIKAHWSVQDGELVNDGHGHYLTTDRNYGDFELLLEYRTVPKADSGVYLRGIPQVQIWDYTEEAKFKIGGDKGSGGLWNNSPGAPGKDPLVRADQPLGQWNRMRIVMVGEFVTVQLNDKLVVDHARMENYFNRKEPMPKAGPIQLQTHGGEIRWRNIQVREITGDEANAILRSGGPDKPAAALRSLFNGKDLTGWKGPVDNYEVREGAIACKPGKGGTIYYDEEFADFHARLEFRLPPGGNNGLAIRYPGNGDAAYAGLCELQVLDDNYEALRGKIDPRQAHGSVYGMVAAAINAPSASGTSRTSSSKAATSAWCSTATASLTPMSPK